MARMKQQELTLEEKLKQALVPEDEQPYKVPENWVWVRLGAITVLNPPRLSVEQLPKTVSFVPMAAVSDEEGKILEAQERPITEVIRGYTPFLENDVLFAKITPCMENGKTAIAKDLLNGVGFGSTEFYVFRPTKCIISKLLYHLLRAQWFRDEAKKNMAGAVGQQRVRKDFLLNYAFPLPPLSEQQRIVDRIESLFAKLDQAKELAQNALDTFETRKAAILHKAFTGELTAKWREKNGVGMESWEETTLGKIIKVSSGKSLTTKDMHHEGNIPVYGGNGITGYHDESNVEANTIVIGRVGFYCGSVHYINQKAWVTDNALIVKFNTNNIDIKFMYRLLSYIDLRKNDSSTAQPVISGSKIYPLKVIIPTLSEQREIVRILDSLFEKEQKAKELCDVIDKIDLIKKAILAKAFRGELGTNGHNEESAVELLKECLGQSFN